jgi:hypothetical protein
VLTRADLSPQHTAGLTAWLALSALALVVTGLGMRRALAAGERTGDDRLPLGAESLCHQAKFVNHASGAITPLDPELIQFRDAVGQLP